MNTGVVPYLVHLEIIATLGRWRWWKDGWI